MIRVEAFYHRMLARVKALARSLPLWMWLVCGASLLLIAGLARDASPWLFGDLDWRWIYNPPEPLPPQVLWIALLLGAYILLAWRLWRWAQLRAGRARWVAAFAVAAALVIQVAAVTIIDPDPLGELLYRTTFPFNAGFFTYAMQYRGSLAEFLRSFPEMARHFSPHPQRHPPGLLLTFMLAKQAFQAAPGLAGQLAAPLQRYACDFLPFVYPGDVRLASALLGLLAPVMTALGIVPLYLAVRELSDETTAMSVALISPLVPAYALWAGVWDPAFVLCTGLVLWLLVLATVKGRRWAWPAAGLLLSLALFFSQAILVLVVFAGVLIVLFIFNDYACWLARWRALLVDLAGFAIMLASVWIVYWLAFGVTFLEVFRANLEPHVAMPSHYRMRLFYNTYDFILFLGFPLGILMLAAARKPIRSLLAGRRLNDIERLEAAFLLTFGMLVVSGIARAEVGRVWIFLMPLAILAACLSGGLDRPSWRWLVVAAVLAVQLLVMQTTLEVNTPRPIYRLANPLPDIKQVGAALSPGLKMEAFSMEQQDYAPGDLFVARIYWRTLAGAGLGSRVELVARPVGLEDGGAVTDYPIVSRWVSTCPAAGDVSMDLIMSRLPKDLPPGSYRVFAQTALQPGAFLPCTGSSTCDVAVPMGTMDVGGK